MLGLPVSSKGLFMVKGARILLSMGSVFINTAMFMAAGEKTDFLFTKVVLLQISSEPAKQSVIMMLMVIAF